GSRGSQAAPASSRHQAQPQPQPRFPGPVRYTRRFPRETPATDWRRTAASSVRRVSRRTFGQSPAPSRVWPGGRLRDRQERLAFHVVREQMQAWSEASYDVQLNREMRTRVTNVVPPKGFRSPDICRYGGRSGIDLRL